MNINPKNLRQLLYLDEFEDAAEKIKLVFSKYQCRKVKVSMFRNMVAQDTEFNCLYHVSTLTGNWT